MAKELEMSYGIPPRVGTGERFRMRVKQKLFHAGDIVDFDIGRFCYEILGFRAKGLEIGASEMGIDGRLVFVGFDKNQVGFLIGILV